MAEERVEKVDGLWKTNDMSLAAFLVLHSEPVRSEWSVQDNTCYWYFADSQELAALVSSFSGNQALVDPKVYSYRYAQMKKEMFALKDSHHAQAQAELASGHGR